jgi:hypothetical protein
MAATKAQCVLCGAECAVEGEIYAAAVSFLTSSRCPYCGPTMARGGSSPLPIPPYARVSFGGGVPKLVLRGRRMPET